MITWLFLGPRSNLPHSHLLQFHFRSSLVATGSRKDYEFIVVCHIRSFPSFPSLERIMWHVNRPFPSLSVNHDRSNAVSMRWERVGTERTEEEGDLEVINLLSSSNSLMIWIVCHLSLVPFVSKISEWHTATIVTAEINILWSYC